MSAAGRPTCYRCFRPAPLCLCGYARRVDNRCRVVVLQHPRERAHPFGTARLLGLGLRNFELHRAHGDGPHGVRYPLSLSPGTALLFPAPGARPLEDLAPAERPRQLLVLDGTWPQARQLYRENAWLHEMLPVRLSPAAPSRYRIRKSPRPEYLSTIESTVAALRLIEPRTPYLDTLLAGFDAMVETQLGFGQTRVRTPRATRRSVGATRLPAPGPGSAPGAP